MERSRSDDMKKAWIAVALALNVCGCASNEVGQSQTDIEQRRQIEQEKIAREARVEAEQAELMRIRAEQRQRYEAAQRAAQSEVPVIQTLVPDKVEEEPLADDPRAVLEDPIGPRGSRTIYYQYDAYTIDERYQGLIQAVGKFLLANKGWKLRVEGNCDERGSREYNLALGQRRADSVKRALLLMGVSARQIQAVSFGSEKPKVLEHDEAAYAQNRRSDLVHVTSESASR
jgi:peptidoglycan-associated lipoprotein